MMTRRWLSTVAAMCLAVWILLAGSQASAQEKLRVGKAVAEAFAFLPLDVGVRQGIFKRHRLDVEITSFGGGARLEQRRRQHRHRRERGP
jgi:ABC-type nitrate/sulfonate/bicarbonate transport system substrate-binding protein